MLRTVRASFMDNRILRGINDKNFHTVQYFIKEYRKFVHPFFQKSFVARRHAI